MRGKTTKGKRKSVEPREWRYTVNRWRLFKHYHVTLFPDCMVGSIIGKNFRVELDQHQKFDTPEEVNNFIRRLRSKLARHGIKLRLLNKDIAR